ncbi:MAG TPA: heparinase II/III family protein [Methylomirabilota bacterium]
MPVEELPDSLRTLRQEHPRLYVLDEDLVRVRQLLGEDFDVRSWRDALQRDAERMLGEPVVERVLVGPRLLAQSRAALRRISTLAGLYRLDGDPRKLNRAREEMLAAAAFENWNPSHFLDVAEMTNALAIGYDWLFDELSVEERVTIRGAIVEKGLRPGVQAYEQNAWWAVEGRNNWTQVCNGGLLAGALAVADEEPALAARILERVQGEGMKRRLALYAPDGGDEEGPGYWDYATSYTVFYLSALETALGSDLGWGRTEGLSETGWFRMHAIGPSGLVFNYADARPAAGGAPQMFWLAGRYERPEYGGHEWGQVSRAGGRPEIFHLLWAPRIPDTPSTAPPPATRFRGVDVAFLRGDWRDPATSWVGFKGGRNTASHAHLDLGTFVMDALGERWAIDLGPDDYNLPGYFGPQRWSYFRLRTESHNTLLVNGTRQELSAKAPLIAFSDDSYRPFAVVDLTEAYAPAVSRAHRGIALVDGRDVLIQDEIEAEAADVIWQMLTRAIVVPDAAGAVLHQGGRTLAFRIVEPAGARLLVGPATAPPPQAEQPEVSILRIVPAERRPRQRFVIWLSPGNRPAPEVQPLAEWDGNRE